MAIKLDTRRLDDIINNLPERGSMIVRTGAFQVQAKAKMLAPVDPGALKSSLQAEEKDNPLHWWVHDGVEYGIFQELGTSRMAAHPFLIPAVESIRRWFSDQMKELFK